MLPRVSSSIAPHSRQTLAATASFSTSTPKPFSEIPGPAPVAPYGTYGEIMHRQATADTPSVLYSYYKQYSPIVKHDAMGHPEVWVFDPELAKSVIIREGPYPRTVVNEVWPFQKYFQSRGLDSGIGDTGANWKKFRMALQKDMFAPAVAESYLPLLEQPVKDIAAVFPRAPRFSDVTNLAAMDMFMSLMLGVYPRVTQSLVGAKEVDPADLQYVKDAVSILRYLTDVLQEPTNPIPYNNFCEANDKVIARNKYYIKLALEKDQKDGDVDPYIVRLIRRKDLTMEDALSSLSQLLFAGIDTTSHALMLLYALLANNPDKQEKLYREVKEVLGDGPLTPETVKSLKYLNYCMRESHRLYPATTTGTLRRLDQDIDIAGYTIPANTRIVFSQNGIQNDPSIVDEPEKFIPERWAPEAVEKRAGTKREVLDHRLLVDPFGFGPRMCLGARVAKSEMKALLCRSVQDYQFKIKEGQKWAMTGFPSFLRLDPYPEFTWTPRK